MTDLYMALKAIKFSPKTYISCQKALNIYDPKHPTGDWHRTTAWARNGKIGTKHILGDGREFSTNEYLDDLDVYEASDVLREMGEVQELFADKVYAASHARAIADMLILESLKEPHTKWTCVVESDLDGWMGMDEDKERVYKLLRIAIPKLPKRSAGYLNDWLTRMHKFDFNA